MRVAISWTAGSRLATEGRTQQVPMSKTARYCCGETTGTGVTVTPQPDSVITPNAAMRRIIWDIAAHRIGAARAPHV
jgi:hypothetical protein